MPERADALLAEYDAAVGAVADAVDVSSTVSIITVYAGESVAIWTDGPVNIPATAIDAGLTLSPGPGDLEGVDGNARLYISPEELGLIDGDAILMLQTSTVEGEDESVAGVMASPLWATLPAVRADRVVEADRLGYPGIEGRIRFAEELPDLLPVD